MRCKPKRLFAEEKKEETRMARPQCSCGYASANADEFADHLLEMFTPDDAIGADGRVHDEIAPDRVRVVGVFLEGECVPALACFCGFATDETSKFDDHVLAMFLTPDRVGVDGDKHMPVVPA
jgi:hypothetical protein